MKKRHVQKESHFGPVTSSQDLTSERPALNQYQKTLWLFLGSQVIFLVGLFGYFHFKQENLSQEILNTEKLLRNDFIEIHHKGPKVKLDDFFLNLQTSKGSQIVRLDVEFYLDKVSVFKEFQKMEQQVRNFSLMILSVAKLKDFYSGKGINFLQDKIKSRLNQFLTEGEIIQVQLKNFSKI